MGLDVLLGPLGRVAAKQVADAVEQQQPAVPNNGFVQGLPIGRQRAQQAGQVGRGPVAVHEGLAKANVSSAQGALKGAPAANLKGLRGQVGLLQTLQLVFTSRCDETNLADLNVAQHVEHHPCGQPWAAHAGFSFLGARGTRLIQSRRACQ